MTQPVPVDPVLKRALVGDPAARRELFARHGPGVWSICRRLSPQPEDDYQAIWEKVLRALPGFDPHGPAPLGAWIATVAHRHLIDGQRRRRVRGEVVPIDGLASSDDPDDRLDRQRRSERLEAALERLPLDQRTVVVLHHLQGVALEGIAQQEGVAVGTVKSRLHRARARLLELLGSA